MTIKEHIIVFQVWYVMHTSDFVKKKFHVL